MPKFVLPEGYSFTPPDIAPSAVIPGYGLYGGADVSQAWDANGVHYVACDASGPGTPAFRWRVFHEIAPGKYTETPLPFVSTGRGEQDVQWFDGRDWAIAWEGNAFNFDVVPGFASFPSIPSLAARIAQLEQTAIAGGGGGAFTLASAPVTNTTWEGRTLESGVLVDVPAVFGVPSSTAYLIRFVAQAGASNVRVRAGTAEAPFFVTVNTQAPNLQVHTQGWTPGPSIYVSAVNGVALAWLQILGWQ